jgi:hypothetical protein
MAEMIGRVVVPAVNYTAMFPVPFDTTTELMEYYLIQGLPCRMALVVGRITDIDFVDRNPFANDLRNQFLNVSMNNTLLFGYFLSFSTYAALLNVPVNKEFSIALAYFDPNTQPGEYNSFGSDIGLAFRSVYKWELGGLEGAVTPIIIYTNKEAIAVDNRHLLPGLLLGDPAKKNDNWIVHLGI